MLFKNNKAQLKKKGADAYRVLTHDLLETNIGVPKERQTPALLHRVSTCMKQLGWNGPKQMRIRTVPEEGIGDRRINFHCNNRPKSVMKSMGVEIVALSCTGF